MKGNEFRQSRQLMILSAVAATALGLAYLGMAGAPSRYLVINTAALAIGLCLVKIAQIARFERVPTGAVTLGIALALLATALFGVAVEGTSRWVVVAGLSIQPSLMLLPLMVTLFAREPDTPSSAAIAIASAALALQPDRAMAGALTAGVLAIALTGPRPRILAALLASGAGFAVTMVRADTQAALPYVDQIFFTSFNVSPLAGLAVLGGSALLVAPAIACWRSGGDEGHVFAVIGAVWLAIVIAAALGNYPTPLVGYGGSAIIGYVLCLIGLQRPFPRGVHRDRAAAHPGGGQGGPSLDLAAG